MLSIMTKTSDYKSIYSRFTDLSLQWSKTQICMTDSPQKLAKACDCSAHREARRASVCSQQRSRSWRQRSKFFGSASSPRFWEQRRALRVCQSNLDRIFIAEKGAVWLTARGADAKQRRLEQSALTVKPAQVLLQHSHLRQSSAKAARITCLNHKSLSHEFGLLRI